MKAATENDVVRDCLAYLALRGVLAWRANNAGVFDPVRQRFRSFRGLRGVSDILGVLDGGRILAVECKGPRGSLSTEQAAFLEAVARRGGLAACARSLDELRRALGEG